MKHLEQTLATYVYNHYNMCNITIYFCNIYMKYLQHISETYSLQHALSRNIFLLLGRMEARRCVVFTEGSSPAALVGDRPVAMAACHGREAAMHDLERAAARRACQGRRPSAATRRQPHAMPSKASG
jgi:hypothetical protein